jgi:ABC-type bacteriocin/lantibiotic exporter with double-glycine peptidase domain
MIFEHLGKEYSEEQMISLCHAMPKHGTSHEHLIEEVKREGFSCLHKNHGTIKDIIKLLDNGYPVIVNYMNPASQKGHYGLVVGYEDDNKVLILADPKNGDGYTLHWQEFMELWHNENNTSKGWFMIISQEKPTM